MPTTASVASFQPPRCPNRRCPMHAAPKPGFYKHRGSYWPKCRSEPVPRFKCRVCERGFSRQTFRIDRGDHRPECNARLVECLVSGVGLRQSGRIVDLSAHGVQYKFRKLALAIRRLNRNLLRQLPKAGGTYLLDEMETFEQTTILRLTMPVLMERTSYAILAVDTAPIRRVPPKGCRRRRWLDRHEAEHGRRPDRSAQRLKRVFGRFRRMLVGSAAELITDQKALYARQVRSVVGEHVHHTTVPSTRPRTVYNPLFPINLTDAMLRDNNGRLRRRSWLHTKKEEFLRAQLELFVAYRNWHRRRSNGEPPDRTPGVVLGIAERSFTFAELVAWRQDWRERSPHPTSDDASRAIGRGRRAKSA